MNPDITIVIPYHNEAPTIEYTLERVGKQTLLAKEAIFVNSTSTDNSFAVVSAWIEKNQDRYQTKFRNIFEHTDTPASSKNAGIKNCRTEWIAFMDCGQNFDNDWLEKQYNFASSHKLDVVSGVVYLVGENWIDRCAAAQTYGYRRFRPCVPTTLTKKKVFDRTGNFLEGRRAGYDAAWPIVLKSLNIERGINTDVRIKYKGYNFSGNIKHLFKKSILYAKPTVAIKGYYTPYLYVLFAVLMIFLSLYSINLFFAIVALYATLRLIIVPVYKSRNFKIYYEHPGDSLGLLPVGIIIDFGKLIGIVQGLHFYYLNRSRFL